MPLLTQHQGEVHRRRRLAVARHRAREDEHSRRLIEMLSFVRTTVLRALIA